MLPRISRTVWPLSWRSDRTHAQAGHDGGTVQREVAGSRDGAPPLIGGENRGASGCPADVLKPPFSAARTLLEIVADKTLYNPPDSRRQSWCPRV